MNERASVRHGELVYGLTVAVDIENFSKLDTLDQYVIQSDLGDVLDTAAGRAELDRQAWYRQVRGDGELAVLPPDADAAWVVARFTEELGRALRELRATGDARRRLRLRVAMHYGTLTAGRFGPVGQAPIVVSRLLDAGVVRRALAQNPDGDLVLVVSEPLFHDVVETRFYGLDPARFRPVRVTAKGVVYGGHVCTTRPAAPQHDDRRPAPFRPVPPPPGLRLIETG